ncbi:MAG: hypothetical protein RIC55_19230 [Pirellulaceae bacterium]
MKLRSNLLNTILLLAGLLCPLSASAQDDALTSALEAVRQVGPKGEGHRQAVQAVQKLSQLDAEKLPQVLAAMDGVGDLPTNWLRAAAEAIASKQLKAGGELPQKNLETFLADTSHSPRARRLAYELIARVDDTAHDRLIPGMLNDPSLELRRDAVAVALEKAEGLKDDDKSAAVETYRTALSAARDLDQIDKAAEALRALGETVNLPEHFGFVMNWHLIGPFDNREKKGFDAVYPPEKEIDLTATYTGKEGEVKWFEHTTNDQYGIVDLNKAIAKHMGAAGYATMEFESDQARDVELRLGCINANKVWLNGKLLTANHVYHAGTQIDQYVGQGRLKKGKNQILVKVCQNEQEDSWAQRWQFQLRVCDQYGTAILAGNRPEVRAESSE